MQEKVISNNEAENFPFLIPDETHQLTEHFFHLTDNELHLCRCICVREDESKRFSPLFDSLGHLPQFTSNLPIASAGSSKGRCSRRTFSILFSLVGNSIIFAICHFTALEKGGASRSGMADRHP
jgi:hypothetical protein